MPETVGVREAAALLGVADKTVRKMIKRGDLPAALESGPYGEQYAIPASALETARTVIDVVRVERPTDPRVLGQAVAAAIEERAAGLQQEIADLRAEVSDLAGQLEASEERRQRAEARRDEAILQAIREALRERREAAGGPAWWERLRAWAGK